MAVVTKDGLAIFLSTTDPTRNAPSSCADGKQAPFKRKSVIVPAIHSQLKRWLTPHGYLGTFTVAVIWRR
jgi:hypothetical protein